MTVGTLLFIVVVVLIVGRLIGPDAGALFHNRVDHHNNALKDVQREARNSLYERERRRRLSEQLPPEAVDEHTKLQREIGAEIDQIASEPGGLMQFDLNGDGMVDNEEMKIAREKIADRLGSTDGEVDPFDSAEFDESTDGTVGDSKYTW